MTTGFDSAANAANRESESQTLSSTGAETARHTSLHEAILDSLCDRLYVFDGDCRYLFVGEQACKQMGLRSSDLIGRHWSDVGMPPEAMRPLEEQIRKVLSNGLPIVDSVTYPWRGKRITIDYTISPVFSGEGEVQSAALLARESASVQERLEEFDAYRRSTAAGGGSSSGRSMKMDKSLDNWVAEQRLGKEATDLRRALLRSISHDYRGPLTAVIAGLRELAERGDKLSPALAHELAVTGLSQALRLERFLDNLIFAASLDEARLIPSLEMADAGELVEDTLVRAAGETSAHRLVVAPDSSGLGVTVDRTLVVQALHNVVANAANYSPEGSSITVAVYSADAEVVFEVTDQGPGIPTSFRDGAVTRHGLRGLGLEITRSICAAHGGELRVSDGEGGGSVVRMVLPAKGPATV